MHTKNPEILRKKIVVNTVQKTGPTSGNENLHNFICRIEKYHHGCRSSGQKATF